MQLVRGGLPDRPKPGAAVRVKTPDGTWQPATVVQARFKTHVFRGHVSVRYQNGVLDLVEEQQVSLDKPNKPK